MTTATEHAALMQAEHAEYLKRKDFVKGIEADINGVDNIGDLDPIYKVWESRMKELAAAILKPGTDEVIDEYSGGLDALDMIWDLSGDYSWSSNQTEPYRAKAIEYYLGRKFQHIWGTGVLSKMKDGGFGIKVRMLCHNCRKARVTVYARPGCHRGAFCYVYDTNGKYLADLRNHVIICDKCPRRGGGE